MDSRELGDLLDELETTVDSVTPLQTKWKPVWDQIRAIAASFKGSRYPSRQEREEAWTRFQSLIGRVREVQTKEDELREGMAGTSERHKYEILAKARDAIPPDNGFAEGLASVFLAPIGLAGALLNRFLPGQPVDETKEALKACSEALSEGWALLSRYKGEMLGHDKQEVFAALTRAKESLQYAWDQWKEAQQKAYEARCQVREERETRRTDLRERVEGHVEKLERWLENLLEILPKREAHLEELREKRDSAWNDGFRERVEGWIDEEEENIQGLREKIERVEGWLEEAREKIR
jgi:hypothetical protein